MKVLIISPCILPVPAVKGGAVLTLIESLIIQNELSGKVELTVVGSYDREAAEVAKRYPNTKFIFWEISGIADKIDHTIDSAIEKLKHTGKTHQYIWKSMVIAKLKKLLKADDYDKVVFQNSGFLLNVLKDAAITEKYKGKLYYHLHNDIPDNVCLESVRKCELLLISEYLLKKINRLCGCDMSGQSHIVKNGFKTERFARKLSDRERSELLDKLKIDEGKKIVIFTGRIIANKGIAQLLEAFSTLERDDTVLMVVGAHNFGSGQTSAFEQKMKSSFDRLGGKIVFTGFVPYHEMWKYYQLADVAVLPSMWEEPAGLTMIEATAAGLPVITTLSGGIPEYMSDEWSILLERDDRLVANIRESIEEVLSHPEEWSRKASEGSRYVQTHFSEEVYYQSFLDAIDG